MYYMRLCSKKLLSDIRERELCLSSFPVLAVFLTPTRLRSCVFPLPLQGTLPESLCTWLLFLESLAATCGASSELESDTVSLPISVFLRLYVSCPDLPLFTSRSILLQERKRMVETPQVDRPSRWICEWKNRHLHKDSHVISGLLFKYLDIKSNTKIERYFMINRIFELIF